jgi:precorrin-6B methylase 2
MYNVFMGGGKENDDIARRVQRMLSTPARTVNAGVLETLDQIPQMRKKLTEKPTEVTVNKSDVENRSMQTNYD